MKLFVFLGLIGSTFFISLLFCRREINQYRKPVAAFLKAFLINLLILGAGSFWWFFTETDGISQVTGVMIYLGAFLLISLINLIQAYIGDLNR